MDNIHLCSLWEPDEKKKAPCLDSSFLKKEADIIIFKNKNWKTMKIVSFSRGTCACPRTSSAVEEGPLHWGARSRCCICMTGWTWPTFGNARHPGTGRSWAQCAFGVASSTGRPCTRHSSWAGSGGRSRTLRRSGGWAPGPSGSESRFCLPVVGSKSRQVSAKVWLIGFSRLVLLHNSWFQQLRLFSFTFRGPDLYLLIIKNNKTSWHSQAET